MTKTIELEHWELEGGEGTYMAWGVHDPEDFVAALVREGWDDASPDDVSHVRFVETDPPDGYEEWYRPVQGEPNATIIYP